MVFTLVEQQGQAVQGKRHENERARNPSAGSSAGGSGGRQGMLNISGGELVPNRYAPPPRSTSPPAGSSGVPARVRAPSARQEEKKRRRDFDDPFSTKNPSEKVLVYPDDVRRAARRCPHTPRRARSPPRACLCAECAPLLSLRRNPKTRSPSRTATSSACTHLCARSHAQHATPRLARCRMPHAARRMPHAACRMPRAACRAKSFLAYDRDPTAPPSPPLPNGAGLLERFARRLRDQVHAVTDRT